MEVTAMYEIKKVEKPQYQAMDEIAKVYWDNWLLMSNVTSRPNGGVVRYFCRLREDGLTDLIMEMDKDSDVYGDCIIRFVGNRNSLGGLFL
jgi:hypothetical protein